jgi:hypothetical protein
MIQFAMQKVFKKIVFPQFIWITLIIFSPICLHLITSEDFNSISKYLCYEAVDQDDSGTILESKENNLISSFVVKHPSEVHPFFEHIPDLPLGTSVSCPRPLFLRC